MRKSTIGARPFSPDAEPRRALRRRLVERLEKLSVGASICPGMLARDCGTVLATIRGDLLALASAGKIRLTQRGKGVSPHDLKGPFRVSLPKAPRPQTGASIR